MTRPDMSIKGKRKLRDMRILGRIARVRSTEQFVWHFLILIFLCQGHKPATTMGLLRNGFVA